MDTAEADAELTDVEVTDTEDEARAANESDPKNMEVKKKTKKMSKHEKKTRAGAKADKLK